jgi:hypothetical protein
MNETAFFRFAGWSAYFNTLVFILSMIALIVFFVAGGIWGRINDTLSVIWMLSYLPLMIALYLLSRTINTPLSLASSLLGIAAAIVFVVLQVLLVLGKVRFEQTFSAVLTMTALFGISILVHGLLARVGNTLPISLTWVMVIYGIASVVGAIGFQIGGEQHPLAMLGLLLNAVTGIVWVLWFGRLLSSSEAIIALVAAS